MRNLQLERITIMYLTKFSQSFFISTSCVVVSLLLALLMR
jgi:hypothetical protein